MKKETVADKIKFQMDIVAMDFENQVETSMKVFYKVLENLLFEAEKEQQERSYSEEEVDVLITLLKQTTEYEVLQSFRDKVEQFKKK